MSKILLYLVVTYLFFTILSFFTDRKDNETADGFTEKYLREESLIENNQNRSAIKNLEILILFRSGIKDLIPQITLLYFFIFEIIIGVISFVLINQLIRLVIPTIVLSLIIVIIPFVVLDFMKESRSKIVSRELLRFISVTSRWSLVKDDVFYCFEKALDQVSYPFCGYIEDFLINIKYTGNITYAFDVLLLQSDNEMYRNFIINMRQAEQSKGNLSILLDKLEEEVYKIESENSRRKSSTRKDRVIIYFTMIGVLFICIVSIVSNSRIRDFYIGTDVGKYLLTLYSVLFIAGIYVTSKITSFDY